MRLKKKANLTQHFEKQVTKIEELLWKHINP